MMKFKIPFSLFLGLVFSLANAQTFKKPKPGSPFINIGLGGGGYMHSPAMSPYDKKFMYTNCDMGCVYVTRDGGKKWRTIPFYDIAGREGIAVFDKKNIYLKGGGISVSSDKGRTWKIRKKFPWPKSKQPFRAFETLGIGSKYLAVGNDSGLWLSQNAGKNWKQTFKKKVIEVAGLGDNIFLAGEKSFWLSKNLGKTWKNISPKNAGAKQIVCITAGQDGAGMVVFVLLDDKSTLLSSRDWGKTWASSKLGGAPVRSRNMVRMASNQSKILFTNRKANKGGELWRSKDSGKTWKRVAYCRKGWAPGTKDSEFAGRHKWGFGRLNFAVDPTNTKRVMFTTMSDIFISTNAGDTWKQMYNDDKGRIDKGSKDFFCTTRGLTMTSAWQFHFDPFDRKRQYICYTDFGFIRSIDGGKSWAGSPPANSTYAIVFDPKKKGRIYGAASGTHDIPGWGFTHDKKYGKGRVVYSDDHGDNWKTLGKGLPNIPCTHLALDKKRSKNGKLTFWATFYGRGGGGLYRSNDTGQTWKQIKGLGYSHNVNFLRVKIQP
ncbi:MAG: hypothetical protein MJH11_14810, partial [Lentisphaeria bacterium]|nr:hypothetical protein [Lentisphaeria bacterium]